MIKKLPEHLIDKIAAGEVVENPASVVKELIENSLDSGARTLDLTIQRGGTKLIRLMDDGCGIPSDQVRLAFARHATSKINDESDLRAISSYGFRGEALPAIASVSIVEMVTATKNSSEGTRIVIEGGNETVFETAQPYPGTVVTVKQLFYNVPARRKFLKSDSSEVRKVVAVFSKYAVSGYKIKMKLNSNEKEVVNFPADDNLIDRLEKLWGARVGSKLIEIDSKPTDGLHIHGFTSRPEINRGNRNQIYIVVNGRPVYDVTLMHAVRSGYGNALDSGFFPLAAIFIDIEPSAVDVNVHPAKTEVRFADERFLYSQIKRIVEAAIKVPVLFTVQSSSKPETNFKTMVKKVPQHIESIKTFDRRPTMVVKDNHHGSSLKDVGKVENIYEEVPAGVEEELDLGGERFWQLYNTFIMGFRDGKIWMIDQHTAHERVLYEAAMNSLYERPGTSQRLLFELTVELELQDMEIFEKHIDLFRRLGFELEPFGQKAIIIRGVPGYFESSGIEKIFRDLLDGFADSLSTGEAPMMALASSVACHAAIKSGEILTQEQMKGLFNRLFECEDPYRCPHGRPTVATLSREDLDKIFKRR